MVQLKRFLAHAGGGECIVAVREGRQFESHGLVSWTVMVRIKRGCLVTKASYGAEWVSSTRSAGEVI
ncbi:hypothetical protein AA102526_1021 [Asaia lannensis NBRC 102526]|nr:hypothetical protein AA102526_1021 [Asaia lannensis NBRC 102526]